jgi:uncharacterized membrane protein YeaQ/YmgE (transglycosylase-associated protein family)
MASDEPGAVHFMKSETGLVMNIVLGIIGAAVASWQSLLLLSAGPGALAAHARFLAQDGLS